MIVWCLLSVTLGSSFDNEVADTAARGKVVMTTANTYIVDFSEYAQKLGYIGNFKLVEVSKELCNEEAK